MPMYSNRRVSMQRTIRSSLRIGLITAVAFIGALAIQAQVPAPAALGRVVLDSYSSKAGLGPVTFDHWLHRSKYTCRVCHVDVGFAMKAKASGIQAKTNREDFHCGACHDGKKKLNGTVIFASCSEAAPGKECARCHSTQKEARKSDFATFTAKFPRTGYGIDWEETEAEGLIKPVDFVEGLSVKRPALKQQEDFSMKSRVTWVSDITFSHKKHTVWNGCELCHPEIFGATKRGVLRYSMFNIKAGQYCGACHGKVAFPVESCSGCHKNNKGSQKLTDAIVLPGPLRASGFGPVKFMHKTHVADREIKCEVCHHVQRVVLPQHTGQEQLCGSCHTRNPELPVKTNLQGAYHNPGATKGVCVDCHKKANAENFNNDVEFARMLLPHHQATIDIARAQLVYGKDAEMREVAQQVIRDGQSEVDQLQRWLKDHEAETWAPVKCHDCHQKPPPTTAAQ
jgi:c(7)-type cytochrome triheme protein